MYARSGRHIYLKLMLFYTPIFVLYNDMCKFPVFQTVFSVLFLQNIAHSCTVFGGFEKRARCAVHIHVRI